MGIARSVGRRIGREAAPGITAGWIASAVDAAVEGIGPFRSVRESAGDALEESHGDVDRAVAALVTGHARIAGAQGFVTNVGGIATMAVAVPAGVSALAVLQCHLVGCVAHLRGHDVGQQRVRNAIMACMLGPDSVRDLVEDGALPGTPGQMATGASVPARDRSRVAEAVASELIAKLASGRPAAFLARRIPGMGGAVGAFTDYRALREIGAYASRELGRA